MARDRKTRSINCPWLRKTDEKAPEKGRVCVQKPEVPRDLRENTSWHKTCWAGRKVQVCFSKIGRLLFGLAVQDA
ncbi:hypothetical protein E3J49_03025 [Candidatus Bathyarchaeota archaeon]|nr:MAG: hypothetical protein E3J49_03025 [Candidatus Bathyarchaeota archaeon]